MTKSSYQDQLDWLLTDTVAFYTTVRGAEERLRQARADSEHTKTAVKEIEQQWETAVQDELMNQTALMKAKDPTAVMTASDAKMREQQFDAHIGAMARTPGNYFHTMTQALKESKNKEVITGLDLSAARDHLNTLLALMTLRQTELTSLTQLVATETAAAKQEADAANTKLMVSLYQLANSQSTGGKNVEQSNKPSKSRGFTESIREQLKQLGSNRQP